MRTDYLVGAAVALILGVGIAGAQQAPTVPQAQSERPGRQPPAAQVPQADPQREAEAEKAQQSTSGQGGKEEPSSHTSASKPQATAVLVDGRLAVPGAPTDSDTVPAKFSAANAADDKLITAAYTFKKLTDEQRQRIYAALKDKAKVTAFNANIGAELPPTIDLQTMPADVTELVPQTGSYRFAVANKRVLLVEPLTRVVVGTLADDSGLTQGSGQRVP
jgi:hypothetical protein